MENENESEIVKIRKRLDKQDDDIRDILILLRGSSAFGVMGMQSMVSDISKSLHQMISDIQHLQRWKK